MGQLIRNMAIIYPSHLSNTKSEPFEAEIEEHQIPVGGCIRVSDEVAELIQGVFGIENLNAGAEFEVLFPSHRLVGCRLVCLLGYEGWWIFGKEILR
jgi:hypothetical protein